MQNNSEIFIGKLFACRILKLFCLSTPIPVEQQFCQYPNEDGIPVYLTQRLMLSPLLLFITYFKLIDIVFHLQCKDISR